MGQKDLYQSDFYESKYRFADVINGVFFKGKEVVKPEELEEADSVITALPNNSQGKKVICDKVKKWKGRYISIMILEAQSYVDYGMVFRVMESEVLGYSKQKKQRFWNQYKKKVRYDSHEYLSRMKKGEKFIPIITLVLYLGKERIWDGETSLHELLELEDELTPYVNDFKLNLFDYHNYNDFKQFKTENRLLFEILSGAGDKKKMFQLLRKEKEYGKLDEESAKAILGILGTKVNIETIKIEEKDGEVRYDMCKAFEDYKEEGRQNGELAMAVKTVKNLMKNQKISFEEAVNFLEIPKKIQRKMQSLI